MPTANRDLELPFIAAQTGGDSLSERPADPCPVRLERSEKPAEHRILNRFAGENWRRRRNSAGTKPRGRSKSIGVARQIRVDRGAKRLAPGDRSCHTIRQIAVDTAPHGERATIAEALAAATQQESDGPRVRSGKAYQILDRTGREGNCRTAAPRDGRKERPAEIRDAHQGMGAVQRNRADGAQRNASMPCSTSARLTIEWANPRHGAIGTARDCSPRRRARIAFGPGPEPGSIAASRSAAPGRRGCVPYSCDTSPLPW